MATVEGDRIHSLSVSKLGRLTHFEVEAILVGNPKVRDHELAELDDVSLEAREGVKVLASPMAKRAIHSAHDITDLNQVISRYTDILLSKDFALTTDDLPVFQVIFLEEHEGTAISRSAWSLSGLKIPILVQINGSSNQSAITSMAHQISIMGHELVHIAARAGSLSIPGANPEDSMLNEEVFASLVEFCDSHRNLLDLEETAPLNITLYRATSVYSDDADLHFREARDLGQSPAGAFLASMILYQGFPTEVRLEADQVDRLLRRCEQLTDAPEDYIARYAEDRFPDEWDQYLRKIETGEED